MQLGERAALVTGAARGIGRGCALELARAGADIVVNDRSPSPESETLLEEIHRLGRRAILVAGDAFERASCEDIVHRATNAFGKLDILISNPAYSRRGAFLEYDPQTFEKTLQGTLTGGFHMSQLVARQMVEQIGRAHV